MNKGMSRNAEGSSRGRRKIDSIFCWGMLTALIVLTVKPSHSFRLATSHPEKSVGKILDFRSKMTSPSSLYGTTQKLLEVEQKFSFLDRSDIEERLRQTGFSPVKEFTMVDWYFDRFVGDEMRRSDMPLIRHDHWLRYREVIVGDGNSSGDYGKWQLKRGNKGGDDVGATVYEEIDGMRAVEISLSLLQEQPLPSPQSKNNEEVAMQLFDGHPVPKLPISGCDVLPFARIVTHRAKWKQDQFRRRKGSL